MTTLQSGAAFKRRDAESYDPVSDSFARFTLRFSQPVAERMVTEAQLAPAHRVLDVATGTGVVALESARRLGPQGTVAAVDLSRGMLATAQRLARTHEAGARVGWQSMDAENLAFADHAFDRVLCLFALLHFPAPDKALAEMHRVLAPGGRLVLALGSRPNPLSLDGLGHVFTALRRRLRQRLGRTLVAPAFLDSLVAQLPASTDPEESALARHGPDRSHAAAALVARAGFSDVRTRWLGFDHPIDSVDEFWELQQTFSSIARKRLATVPANAVAALRADFERAAAGVLARGGTLTYPVGVLLISARRP